MLQQWVAFAVLAAALAGCSSRPPRPEDEVSRRLNEDYRAGYGFGNPNNERRKQGLAPVDMPSYQDRD